MQQTIIVVTKMYTVKPVYSEPAYREFPVIVNSMLGTKFLTP